MKVFVTTVANEIWSRDLLSHFHVLASQDRVREHSLAEDAKSADVILFIDLHQFPTDWQLKALQSHPLSQKYNNKIMVYDERDRPHSVFPGLYVSMNASHFDASRQRACAFYHLKNELIEPVSNEPDLLFSFQGANSHAARGPVLKLSHPRAVIEDTTQINFFDFSDYSETQEYKERVCEQKKRYQEVVSRSKFVLCPRGMGTSSFRLFETLAAGRVPVIISDQWVAPRGPDWEFCSIRVAESQVASLPALLEEREAHWEEMALNAIQVFRDWFAPDMMFHRLMGECQDLLQNGELGRKRFDFLEKTYSRNGYHFYVGRLRSDVGLQRRRLLAKLKR